MNVATRTSRLHDSQLSNPHLEDVFEFWNMEACGTSFVTAEKHTQEFFEKFRAFRYSSEWHIPQLVPFSETKGKSVLEIGCGNGADGVLFATAGARYTGVDLTDAAVDATRHHFRLLGLQGTFQKENAERLSFPDNSFDYLYSHGVLHHTENPCRAFSEVFRVLKPGGRAVLMLYHKKSFNYYARILTYMRGRVCWTILKRAGHISADRDQVGRSRIDLRGNRSNAIWQAHYENFLRYGWAYLRSSNFVHHATDGPACPFARVYTKAQVHKMFGNFRSVSTRCAHFPIRNYKFARWVPLRAEGLLAAAFGWYLFIYLTK